MRTIHKLVSQPTVIRFFLAFTINQIYSRTNMCLRNYTIMFAT